MMNLQFIFRPPNQTARLKARSIHRWFTNRAVPAIGFIKENADAMAARLKAAGFDTYIATEQGETVSDSPAKKSVDEIAREVLAGKWGNGEDCKNRLIAAGYVYTAVQAIVTLL